MLFVYSGLAQVQKYDVVVYGGTPSGVMASVAASREGSKVLLIETTRHVGGLNSSGLGTSDTQGMVKLAVSGLPMKLYTQIGASYGENKARYTFEPKVFEKACMDMLTDSKVTILFERHIGSLKKRGTRIIEITLDNGTTVRGAVFIDASYEGDLMAQAGVKYTYGREGTSKYGETLAGIRYGNNVVDISPYDDNGKLLPGFALKDTLIDGKGDNRVQSYNFRLLISTKADRIPFPKPKHYDPGRYIILSRLLKTHPETPLRQIVGINTWDYPKGKFELNNRHLGVISLSHIGGNVAYPDASYEQRKEIYEDHKNWTLGLLYYLANDPEVPEKLRKETNLYGLATDEFQDNENFPYQLYIREARRMVGSYIHTEHDILSNRTKTDAIAVGAHWIDSHPVQRVALSKTQFRLEGRISEHLKEPYEISYRSLVPVVNECTNLIVPVCLSASHVGFCSIRVEPTWMTLGECAGIAASMAHQKNVNVQAVNIAKLQQALIKNGVMISADQKEWPVK